MNVENLSELAEKIALKIKEISDEDVGKANQGEPFDGTVPVSDDLVAAVKILSMLKYRKLKKWEISCRYSFDGEKWTRKLEVRDDELSRYINFTTEETIILATALARKFEQQ